MALQDQKHPHHPFQQPHVTSVSAAIISGHHHPSPPIDSANNSLKSTGLTYYSKEISFILKEEEERNNMSRRNAPKLELKLNLSPPRVNHRQVESPSRSLTVSPTSPPSSCVSSELNYSSSPEATSMMLVGCPRCLMYVMLAEEDPRCPKCKSTVLLDVIHDNTAAAPGKKHTTGMSFCAWAIYDCGYDHKSRFPVYIRFGCPPTFKTWKTGLPMEQFQSSLSNYLYILIQDFRPH